MKVENMTSGNPNSFAKVANQFKITDDKGVYFQSYNSIIVFIPKGHFTVAQDKRGDNKIHLDKRYWDYSSTTGKYRNIFLGETKAETQKKIDSGKYILTDLN